MNMKPTIRASAQRLKEFRERDSAESARLKAELDAVLMQERGVGDFLEISPEEARAMGLIATESERQQQLERSRRSRRGSQGIAASVHVQEPKSAPGR